MTVSASVRRGTLGDREVRLSTPTPTALGAFRHCRAGATVAKWNARVGVWQVPPSIWPCIRDALTRAGVTVNEENVPVPDHFQRSRDRLQRAQEREQQSDADARWIGDVMRDAERLDEGESMS